MIEITDTCSGKVLWRTLAWSLNGADLRNVRWPRANLRHQRLNGAVLCQAVLDEADLLRADLLSANLVGASLMGARLCRAVCTDATFVGAYLTGADFEGAFLRGADFQHAVLRSANLRHSVLTNADLRDADLRGSDLRGAALETADLDGVLSDETTRWPPGFARVRNATEPAQGHAGVAFPRATTSRLRRASSGTMRVWTLQPTSLWVALRDHDRLTVDQDYIDTYYLFTYEWLRSQMALRIPHYEGGFPWWGWCRPKPDLRRRWWGGLAGTPLVRLELAIPAERVLLSNYMAWHMILNRGFLGITDAETAAWLSRLEQAGFSDTQWPLPEPWQTDVIQSWANVFALEALEKGGSWSTDLVQGVFEFLNLDEVIEVTEFSER
jgi:uncharacterized protein YjbI with pentapeptide repeats